MSFPSRTIQALLATARIANVPSVVSNVWLGVAFTASTRGWEERPSSWMAFAILSLAGVLIYLSGNFLNDWYDRSWDARHRPERALPSGLFEPSVYLTAAIAFGMSGALLASRVHEGSGYVAFALLLFIILYTLWHKRSPWAVIPMGICRALLPLMGAIPFLWPSGSAVPWGDLTFLAPLCGALLLYIAGLSLSARYESMAHPPAFALSLSRCLLIGSGVSMSFWWLTSDPRFGLLGLIPFALWLARSLTTYRRPIPAHVSALLAGIPLLDWAATLPFALIIALSGRPAALSPFLLALWLLPPLAFLGGRALQKLAAAT